MGASRFTRPFSELRERLTVCSWPRMVELEPYQLCTSPAWIDMFTLPAGRDRIEPEARMWTLAVSVFELARF